MLRFVLALLTTLACLPVTAQDAAAQKKFIGTWEAKSKDKVVCTIRLNAGEPISGETVDCSISIDNNGDLQEPQSDEHPDSPSPVLNAVLNGETLTFEEKDGDDVLKFEMKLVGEGQAALTILNAPMPLKPIPFRKK